MKKYLLLSFLLSTLMPYLYCAIAIFPEIIPLKVAFALLLFGMLSWCGAIWIFILWLKREDVHFITKDTIFKHNDIETKEK